MPIQQQNIGGIQPMDYTSQGHNQQQRDGIQPMDYTSQVRNPFEASIQGIHTGVGLAGAIRQFSQADAMQKQMQLDLGNLAGRVKDGTAGNSDFASTIVKYPQLSEHFKRGFDIMDAGKKQATLGQASQVYAALTADQPEIAKKLLDEQALAARNSGDEPGAKAAETLAQLVTMSPETAKTSTGLMLSAVLGPDKFAETFGKLGGEQRAIAKAPAELSETQAKAQKAATDAKFAESTAVMDLSKKGWDITKIQNDIDVSKKNSRIAALNAAISRETNDLKRQENTIKLADMTDKRDALVLEKAAKVESARFNIDNMLNTADKIIATPKSVIESAAGPISSRSLTLKQSTADFEALIENIDAQSFLSQIPNMTGMGSLSDAEGRKLGAALQNFSLKQSPDRLLANVQEAQRLILKARKNMAEKFGVPDTLPDRPNVPVPGMPEGFKILGKR
jgi:hypothetical protein